MRETASMLAGAFSAVTDVGPKWSKLDAAEAARLWEEMAQSILYTQALGLKTMDALGAEDDDDEDE